MNGALITTWAGIVVPVLSAVWLDGRRTRARLADRMTRVETRQDDTEERVGRLERGLDRHIQLPHQIVRGR